MGETRYMLFTDPTFYIGMIIKPYPINSNNMQIFLSSMSHCSLFLTSFLVNLEDFHVCVSLGLWDHVTLQLYYRILLSLVVSLFLNNLSLFRLGVTSGQCICGALIFLLPTTGSVLLLVFYFQDKIRKEGEKVTTLILGIFKA